MYMAMISSSSSLYLPYSFIILSKKKYDSIARINIRFHWHWQISWQIYEQRIRWWCFFFPLLKLAVAILTTYNCWIPNEVVNEHGKELMFLLKIRSCILFLHFDRRWIIRDREWNRSFWYPCFSHNFTGIW